MELCARIRTRHPLVHCISNLVTANDCANLVLAVGGSPIMAQCPDEMEEITSLAHALVLNTGTPDAAKWEACRLAGHTANRRKIPVVLDPVGVGASRWRREQCCLLLQAVQPTLVRVNGSEARALLEQGTEQYGVDSPWAEQDAAALAIGLAKRLHCVVLLSGEEDHVTDGERLQRFSGGSRRMQRLTGAGCMLSALCGCFAAVEPDAYAAACAAAACWKQCAAQAEAHSSGMGGFHTALLDAASRMG